MTVSWSVSVTAALSSRDEFEEYTSNSVYFHDKVRSEEMEELENVVVIVLIMV